MKNKNFLIVGFIVLATAIFWTGSNLYNKSKSQKAAFLYEKNSELFIPEHAPRFGEKEAKVYITEFLDPECESCRAFHPKVKRLIKDYKGKVQLVVRYAPFHGNSEFAIKVLEAARKQGKYADALDVLFAYQPLWGSHHNPRPELIWQFLPKAGVDIEKIKEDMNSVEIKEQIESDVKAGKTLGVRATPTFFVNGRPLEKFGFSYLSDLIHEEVKKLY